MKRADDHAAIVADPRNSMADTTHTATGLELKLRRVASGVTQARLAAELGVTYQAVGNLEARLRPSAKATSRYLAALQQVSAE